MMWYVVGIILSFVCYSILVWGRLKTAGEDDRTMVFMGIAVASLFWPVGIPYLILRLLLEKDTHEPDSDD